MTNKLQAAAKVWRDDWIPAIHCTQDDRSIWRSFGFFLISYRRFRVSTNRMLFLALLYPTAPFL